MLSQEEAQQEKWASYGVVKKNFYIEDPEIRDLSNEQVEKIRKENNDIKVQHTFDLKDSDTSDEIQIPNPIETFEQAFRVHKLFYFNRITYNLWFYFNRINL